MPVRTRRSGSPRASRAWPRNGQGTSGSRQLLETQNHRMAQQVHCAVAALKHLIEDPIFEDVSQTKGMLTHSAIDTSQAAFTHMGKPYLKSPSEFCRGKRTSASSTLAPALVLLVGVSFSCSARHNILGPLTRQQTPMPM